MLQKDWKKIKAYLANKLDVSPRLIDYISVCDILMNCVEGKSNRTISFELNMDLGYIQETIIQFLGFYGWTSDLDIAPILWYNKSNEFYEAFKYHCVNESIMMTDEDILNAFRVCRIFSRIDKELNEYYNDNN